MVRIKDVALIGNLIYLIEAGIEIADNYRTSITSLTNYEFLPLEASEVTVGCFMDIGGDFDNTGFEIIRLVLEEREVPSQ